MLIEGFRGNSLLDVEFDMTQLPVSFALLEYEFTLLIESDKVLENYSGEYYTAMDTSTG